MRQWIVETFKIEVRIFKIETFKYLDFKNRKFSKNWISNIYILKKLIGKIYFESGQFPSFFFKWKIFGHRLAIKIQNSFNSDLTQVILKRDLIRVFSRFFSTQTFTPQALIDVLCFFGLKTLRESSSSIWAIVHLDWLSLRNAGRGHSTWALDPPRFSSTQTSYLRL